MMLQGKVALVTGGTSGIGKAIALRYAQEGAGVCICAERDDDAEQVLADIRAAGAEGLFVRADVSDEGAVKELIRKCAEHWGGRLDILVNNAAIGIYKRCEDVTMDEWDLSFNVNLKGYWLCSKYALPYLKQSQAGSIINLSSVHAFHTSVACAPYSVTKGGIVSLTRCLAIDNGPYGIRANVISPGLIYTEATAQGLDLPDRKERMYEKIRQNECLGRMGQPEEVAGAAVFLAGKDSSFMTGSVLYVDGGAHARLYGNVYEEYDREQGS